MIINRMPNIYHYLNKNNISYITYSNGVVYVDFFKNDNDSFKNWYNNTFTNTERNTVLEIGSVIIKCDYYKIKIQDNTIYILQLYEVKNTETLFYYHDRILEKRISKEKDDQIYPINITSNYIKNKIKLNNHDYIAYFNLSLELNYKNNINISGLVIPIEYFFIMDLAKNNIDINNKINEYKLYFIEILVNLLINISKLSDILILYDHVNDVLNIICTNYKKVLFTISKSNNTIVYKYNSNKINLYKSNNLPSLE